MPGLSKAIVLFSCLTGLASAGLWESDLKRAKTWRPRSGFRGAGTLASANKQLNRHLVARAGHTFKACEDFSVHELRGLLRELLPLASEELKGIYSSADGRRAAYGSTAEMEEAWARAPATDERVRDAHCHEAVMWFVHHLTSEAQSALALRTVLPKLPVGDHSSGKGERSPEDHAGRFYDEKITCQNCHVGGIDSLGVPEVKPETDHEKARRCYTNYKELFGVDCGPCDGIAGPYRGDADKYFTATPCVVVAKPDEVPEAERVPVALPHQFSVDVVGGSDRFGRTTNPVHDQLPGPIAKLYGQIYGKWFMDAKPDADLWLLRHDTTYASLTENGIPIPFIKPKVSEIHSQTAKQRALNITGPMVSLIHGMPSFVPGGCTCIPDPVGVPDISASMTPGLSHMKYMGRIKLPKLEYLEVPIELDHYANWFFHIFMDTNKSTPHFGKAPSRLASAYAGTAVYANWKMEDPKISDPTVWHREIPTSPMKVGPARGQFCMNVKKADFCSGISQATFPPKGEPASAAAAAEHPLHSGLPFFPGKHTLEEALQQLRAAGEDAQVFV